MFKVPAASVLLLLVAIAGCAGSSEADDPATDNAALSGAADAPDNCVLKLTEQVPAKKVTFRFATGQATNCAVGLIPESQIVDTTTLNQAPVGAKLTCLSSSHSGPGGAGEGVAVFSFESTIAEKKFQFTPTCDPAIPSFCAGILSGADVRGPTLLLGGTSADKTEAFASLNAVFSTHVDTKAKTADLIVEGTRLTRSGATAATVRQVGRSLSLASTDSAKLEATAVFLAKEIEGFGLDNAVELKCSR